jgi:hypothetical protein
MPDDMALENEAHRRGDDREEDDYRCWWECPVHDQIEDGFEERDEGGDAICPHCGALLDFYEDDGLDPMMEESGDD